MKVPLSLLKEYLNFNLSPEELAKVLTEAGIEVEGIETTPLKFSGVVVGEVLETARHPSADRLCVAKVTDGTEVFQVVCGASNCRPGLKTALAKIGATLTDEAGKSFKIKKGKLRDVESFGMLCAADELGLGTGEGIMELSDEFVVGTDLAGYYGDVILEVSLTPNLGHCMSMLGIARELSAQLGIPVKQPKFEVVEEGDPIEKHLSAALIDQRQCLRYACRGVWGIKVGPSPEWLKKKVEACGIRSVNNVVDVGNLVMCELGQPLHMFDADKISGKKIIITSHTEFKELVTLDEVTRPIPEESLLICDADKPLAFAGVMGGKSSAVNEQTVNVAIEAACFTPQSVRKTCRWLGLKTDSSQRFEKGIDPNGVVEALNYATYLLHKVAGGKILRGVIDHKTHEFVEKKIAIRPDRVNKLLGTSLSAGEIASLLRKLEMTIESETNRELIVRVPTYRNDISIEEDLIEEVARVYGYNNLPILSPLVTNSTIPHAPIYLMEKQVRQKLVAEGLQEMVSCDLISPAQAEMVAKDAAVPVLQAHSADQSVLRTSLLPGLLQAVKFNADHGTQNIAAFEVGRLHFKESEGRYVEPTAAAIILSGLRSPYHWDPKPEECDFFDLKGIVENLLDALKIEHAHFEPSHLHTLHPGRQARIKIGDAVVGVLGEVHPELVKKIDIPQRVFFAELELQELMALMPKQWKVEDVPQFPDRRETGQSP